MKEVFEDAVDKLGNGEPVVLATVIRTKGSTPQKPGAKLLVRQDGSGVGTLGAVSYTHLTLPTIYSV